MRETYIHTDRQTHRHTETERQRDAALLYLEALNKVDDELFNSEPAHRAVIGGRVEDEDDVCSAVSSSCKHVTTFTSTIITHVRTTGTG